MYATWPATGRLKPALEPDDPPAPPPVELVPALDVPPRRARKREARLAAAPAEELEVLWPFSTSTPPMNPQAISSTPVSARGMGFPPAPSRRRRGRRGSSVGSSSHSSCASI